MRHILASTILLSSMFFPLVANASSSTDDATAPTPSLRVSTGVIAPKLARSIVIDVPDALSRSLLPMDAEVGLSLTVDSNGQTQDVKVVKPSNPYWDARVVEAVQKAHFRPGSIDHTPIPVDLNLTVLVAH